MRYLTRCLATITEEDVRDPVNGPLGRGLRARVRGAIGRIMQCDIGKRVYLVPTDDGTSTVIQVESDAQRDARLARSK